MTELGRLGRLTGRMAFFCMMLMSLLAVADQRRCPVCHEIFDSHVEICPNDGTDLKLLGEKWTGDTAEGASDAAGDEPDSSDNPADGATDNPETGKSDGGAAEGTDGAAGKHKYIRHDKGGRRRRAADETAGDERTDRLRRLNDRRAGAVVVKKQEEEPGFSEEMDAELREKYRVMRDMILASRPIPPQRIIVRDEGSAPDKELWEQTAPILSVGSRFSWMGEADSPGLVAGAEIDFNLLRSNIRAGFSSFIGVRHVGRKELMFLESASIGVQRPWRFSPFIEGRFGIGAIVSHRFGEDVTYLLRGIGFDTGIDCHISDAFVVTPGVGYIRYGIRPAVWDSVTLSLSLGF